MNIKFNIEKSQRKALAQKIGELTISMPRDFFGEQGLEYLLQIIENKEMLLKHALNTESVV